MTREEAISFLQEIKYNLDYLKNHYTQLGFNAKEHSKVINIIHAVLFKQFVFTFFLSIQFVKTNLLIRTD